jgi:hypothetical protein
MKDEAEEFLALGLCSEAWFRGAIDGLLEAEKSVPLAGSALVHGDVRSDNVCFVGDRTVLVDWSEALRGHPYHDLTTALSTLPLEGGPDPFDILPEGGAWAEEEPAAEGAAAMDGAALAEPLIEGARPFAGLPDQGVQEGVEEVARLHPLGNTMAPPMRASSWPMRSNRARRLTPSSQ